jgi:uncharacterized protein with GYD domain
VLEIGTDGTSTWTADTVAGGAGLPLPGFSGGRNVVGAAHCVQHLARPALGRAKMSTYLFHAFQTPETLAKLLAAPEDRAAAIAPLFRSLGGELLGYWYVLGGVEVYVMFDLPDDVAATGMSARVASSGAFVSPTCTRLMTVQETLAALGGAGGATVYRAPGQPE